MLCHRYETPLFVLTLALCSIGCNRYQSADDAFKHGDYLKAASMWLERAEHGDWDAAIRCMAALEISHDPNAGKAMLARLTKLEEQFRFKTEEQSQGTVNMVNILRSEYQLAADQGNADNVQHLLAKMCAGVESERLLKLAAQNGQPEAQFKVGLRHLLTDRVAAAKWYELSASKGYDPALVNLASMYKNGDGVPQNFEEAAKLLLESAQHGFAYAQIEIGEMYANGQGVPQDFVQAHVWFNLAGVKSVLEPDRKRANEARDAIAGKMTPLQIAEAQRLAKTWQPKSGGW